MTREDRFGLRGDPELQDARRVAFGRGSASTSAVMLALATLLPLLHLDEAAGFSPAGQLLFVLDLLVLTVAWVQWHRVWRHRPDAGVQMGAVVYGVTLWLRMTAGVVSDWTLGHPTDRMDVTLSLALGSLFLLMLMGWRQTRPPSYRE